MVSWADRDSQGRSARDVFNAFVAEREAMGARIHGNAEDAWTMAPWVPDHLDHPSRRGLVGVGQGPGGYFPSGDSGGTNFHVGGHPLFDLTPPEAPLVQPPLSDPAPPVGILYENATERVFDDGLILHKELSGEVRHEYVAGPVVKDPSELANPVTSAYAAVAKAAGESDVAETADFFHSFGAVVPSLLPGGRRPDDALANLAGAAERLDLEVEGLGFGGGLGRILALAPVGAASLGAGLGEEFLRGALTIFGLPPPDYGDGERGGGVYDRNIPVADLSGLRTGDANPAADAYTLRHEVPRGAPGPLASAAPGEDYLSDIRAPPKARVVPKVRAGADDREASEGLVVLPANGGVAQDEDEDEGYAEGGEVAEGHESALGGLADEGFAWAPASAESPGPPAWFGLSGPAPEMAGAEVPPADGASESFIAPSAGFAGFGSWGALAVPVEGASMDPNFSLAGIGEQVMSFVEEHPVATAAAAAVVTGGAVATGFALASDLDLPELGGSRPARRSSSRRSSRKKAKKSKARKPMRRKSRVKAKAPAKKRRREDRTGVSRSTYRGQKVYRTKNGRPYVILKSGPMKGMARFVPQ